MIQQGDQYILPIKITLSSTVITPENVDDVRIQVGEVIKYYSKNEITYADNYWNYYLTEAQSQAIQGGGVSAQVGILNNEDIKQSDVKIVPVGHSIIKENW